MECSLRADALLGLLDLEFDQDRPVFQSTSQLVFKCRGYLVLRENCCGA